MAESGFYHVRLRGNGRQTLFESDADRLVFLDLIRSHLIGRGIEVIAWCLMGDHIHLVLRDEGEQLSNGMHGLASAYARHFNRSSGHVGHVFQGRYGSSPIETDAYLLEAVRYVHNNPAKAGICAARDYPWSSYREYSGDGGYGIASTRLVLDMIGDAEQFERFSDHYDDEHYRPRFSARMSDEEAMEIARAELGGTDPSQLKSLPVERRDALLRTLRERGISPTQLERLSGIGRKTIARVTK